MKKIFTICAVFAAGFNANAQTNLGIEFVNYTEGQTFSEETIQTEFVITNLGSTHYHTGDTIYVSAKINGSLFALDLIGSGPTPILVTGMLHNGDTLHRNPGVLNGPMTLAFFPGATTLEMCMVVWGKGMASVTPTYGGDVNTANNTTCATFDPNFTGIESAEHTALSIYPNPASEQIILDGSSFSNADFLQIMDINGRTIVSSMQIIGKTSIDVSNWSNGLYSYRLHQKDGNSVTGKFAVSH
jgi:hypothetical protein